MGVRCASVSGDDDGKGREGRCCQGMMMEKDAKEAVVSGDDEGKEPGATPMEWRNRRPLRQSPSSYCTQILIK